MKIVIDGHTASGKSTIAKRICERIGSTYLKPYDATVGEINRWVFDERPKEDLQCFRKCVDNFFLTSSPRDCVFDRLFPSTLSMLPNKLWPQELPLRETTFILWTSPQIIEQRLALRGRNNWTREYHEFFSDAFRKVAETYDVPLIDTEEKSEEDVVDQIVSTISL